MNYTEFFQQAAIACLAPLSVADKCHPKHGAALAAEYAEALADELVKRGRLQPPVNRVALVVEAEPEHLPESAPERRTTCASCFFCGSGMWCSKHDEYVNPGSTCPSYQ